jgi:transketolase
VGSLAGITPGGPGHSHQAVRDISSLAAIPGLTILEPSTELEVSMALDWAINKTKKSTYIRLVSNGIKVPFHTPLNFQMEYGKGARLRDGRECVIVGAGPLVLSSSILAADELYKKHGLKVGVINLPWLNYIDAEWLLSELVGVETVICIDNHYRIGGQADRVISTLSQCKKSIIIHSIGLHDFPPSGSNLEVIDHVGLGHENLVNFILNNKVMLGH